MARSPTRAGSATDRVCTVLVPRRSRLRRPSDRWETASAWGALVLLLLLAPLTLAVGGAQAQQVRDQAAAVRATAHRVDATVTAVSTGPETNDDGTARDDLVVTVSWTEPGGARSAPQVTYGHAPRVGDPWPLWVAPDLAPVQPPATEQDAELQGVVTAVGAFLGSCVALASGLALVRWLLDRRRLRQWQRDWLTFERRRHRGPAC